jgi:GMP synthase (glutamine-hydrolysing)
VSEKKGILILDFGSQVTMLIARRLRDLGYYCEIKGYTTPIEEIKTFNSSAIILSGGPYSVYDNDAPTIDVKRMLEFGPVLGICYGMQLLAHQLGGTVKSAASREYGLKKINWLKQIKLQNGFVFPSEQTVWMSHGDVVEKVPTSAEIFCQTEHYIAGFTSEKFWAFQFHPEVTHTENGNSILQGFLDFAGCEKNWNSVSTLDHCKNEILKLVKPDDHVLCALSGGVDSSVVATLLTHVLGAERVHCVFVDNGLLRHQEFESVLEQYKKIGLNVIGINAQSSFLSALKGLSDPELKRKAIGQAFIEIFDRTVQKELLNYKNKIKFLAQGTLYPDVIESVSSIGGSVTIKSHHNVGGLPAKMNLKLVEPVRLLFKDEVRIIGKQLCLKPELVQRHPFPGPGLSIRIIGEVTAEKLEVLKKADHIFISYLKEKNLYEKIWQAFCVLLPVQTVGVMGDGRTYENVLALRAVTSTDGMTADWYNFDSQSLKEVSNLITNQVKGINRVVYDITSKPPATIEWE